MSARRKRETRETWIVVDNNGYPRFVGGIVDVLTMTSVHDGWRVLPPVTYEWPPAPRKARKK